MDIPVTGFWKPQQWDFYLIYIQWPIPVVGAALAVILPLLMGPLTSVQLSLWVEPRLFKRKWDNPILTLIILLAMADTFGVVGIIVAPPLSAVCQTLWTLLVSNRLAPGPATQVSDLKERQAHLQAAIREMGDLPPPLVTSSMERLADLLDKAEPILQASALVRQWTGNSSFKGWNLLRQPWASC